MEEIIERMIRLEEEAQRLTEKAEKERESFDDELEHEIRGMHEKIKTEAEQKREAIREFEEVDSKKRLCKIGAELEENLKKLEDAAEKNSGRWVEALVNTVLK